MFLGSEDKVYILDKVEGNAQQIGGHSAYASVWLAVPSQSPRGFIKLLSGTLTRGRQHLWMSRPTPSALLACIYLMVPMLPLVVTMLSVLAEITLVPTPPLRTIPHTKTIVARVQSVSSALAQATSTLLRNALGMTRQTDSRWPKSRWYPGAEPLADGTVVLIGGFVGGGYINRNYPNTDPDVRRWCR
jgi:hypothetical protein